MFIKVTGQGAGIPIYLDAAGVYVVEKAIEGYGGGSIVVLAGSNSTISVKEPAKEIVKMLEDARGEMRLVNTRLLQTFFDLRDIKINAIIPRQ